MYREYINSQEYEAREIRSICIKMKYAEMLEIENDMDPSDPHDPHD